MEKYIVTQLEHTFKHTCMLDCDFIAFPTAASASSRVLQQSNSHSLGTWAFLPAVNDACTTHMPQLERTQIKAELRVSLLLKISSANKQLPDLLGCQLSQVPREPSMPVSCLFGIPLQSFSFHFARKCSRSSLYITASLLTRKAKLLCDCKKLGIFIQTQVCLETALSHKISGRGSFCPQCIDRKCSSNPELCERQGSWELQ